ncbi:MULTISPECIES: 2,3-bisphosphoglycerate-dependent phosphoglycerate mutase [unclassified Streptomyces]|uniref:2,3-bisphosphoglycerate-dependent phosphoglycerate mutase n=1 Tax=unclassified Streptomyces TaxID=2593676 RepID=UPI000B87E371|nr:MULTISPECIES: 2,3-bisphosphoglycerate-dependent phosphoglycerate mutase [unclassified Streptomyces]MYZ40189.1 2,3-bisphosphoglycerate-dependent phosphoglycerate mutase [Streptomyces sp. SID4917]
MHTLILLRHGESEWNSRNLFTGWVDVDLTPHGEEQAREAGRSLRTAGLLPDVAHTSVLRRSVRTGTLALAALGRPQAPLSRDWRLNERHYGALQGRDKSEVLREYGAERFRLWRRSYDLAPPPLPPGDDEDGEPAPRTESLADVSARLLPHWYEVIAPDLRAGRTVLVVAHSNSLRALAAHLDGLDHDELMELNIPTGIPLCYTLDEHLAPVVRGGRYLDPVGAAEAARAVAKEGHRDTRTAGRTSG